MEILYSGKVTVYLGKRDFIDHLDHIDPIDGVVVVENDYLQGRKIFGQVSEILTLSIYKIHIPIELYPHMISENIQNFFSLISNVLILYHIFIFRSRQLTDMAAKRTKLWESSSAKNWCYVAIK